MADITYNFTSIKEKFNVIDDEVRLYSNIRFYEYMIPYIPCDTGNLWKSAKITKSDITFGENGLYPVDYAVIVYNGQINGTFHTDKHPYATAFWDKPTIQAHKDDLSKDITKFIRENKLK